MGISLTNNDNDRLFIIDRDELKEIFKRSRYNMPRHIRLIGSGIIFGSLIFNTGKGANIGMSFVAAISVISIAVISSVVSILKDIDSLKEKVESAKKKMQYTVVRCVLEKRSLNNFFAVLILTIILLFTGHTNNTGISTVLVLCSFLLVIDIHILKYRIEKGYFGTTKHEAREIIEITSSVKKYC